MSQDEMQKKIEALVNDAEFAAKLSQCETFDEIAALFGTEGIEVSGEELENAMALVPAPNENGEISEDSLEQVSGGVAISFAAASLVVSIVSWGAPYAWKAGQAIGKVICNKYLKKK